MKIAIESVLDVPSDAAKKIALIEGVMMNKDISWETKGFYGFLLSSPRKSVSCLFTDIQESDRKMFLKAIHELSSHGVLMNCTLKGEK